MPIPQSLTFYADNGQFLEWTLSINTATVTASLYVGRNRFHSEATPGSVVPGFDAIPLAYVAASDGLYRGEILGTAFSPEPGLHYVLVVDATANGYTPQHWEVPAVVQTRAA